MEYMLQATLFSFLLRISRKRKYVHTLHFRKKCFIQILQKDDNKMANV